jgi:uncharacterized delta-60 repeat protein
MGPFEKRLGLIFEQAAMQVGDIPAEGVISVDYTIESAYALREEVMDHLPIFWEVRYIDETSQQQMIVARSEAPFSEPQVTTETASPAVASLSGSCVIREWAARYNGPANSRDSPSAMVVDASGNIYVTGSSYGDGTDVDYATVKYDSSGNQLWIARYNGPGNCADRAKAIAVDPEGNVYVTGQSYADDTASDYATVKYDSSGNELWVARYNGPLNLFDYAEAIAMDAEGNVYVTGRAKFNKAHSYDYATIKYDSSGNELWVASYNGPMNLGDEAMAMAVDAEGNVHVTGWSNGGSTDIDYATVKYDSSGNELWVARYDGGQIWNKGDWVRAIALDAEGNVYVTGNSFIPGSGDCATVKYDSSGNELWIARYNSGLGMAIGLAIAPDASGNVYVTGSSDDGSGQDSTTLKYDSSGNELWVARYNGQGNSGGYACAIAVDPEGNIYVTGSSHGGGSTYYDYATVKYDPSGNELWAARYNGPENDQDIAEAIALDPEGNVYVTGYSCSSNTGSDYATIKYVSFEDPAEAIKALIAAVVSLNLQHGISNSLDAKLGSALNALDDVNQNNDGAAINTLESFIKAVEAQRGKEVSEPDAYGLIQAAVNIINMLSGP